MSTIDETKIDKDKQIADSHPNYSEFEQYQIIGNIKQGDKIQVRLLDASGTEKARKEYTAKYINCHVNFVIQDKGVKTIEE